MGRRPALIGKSRCLIHEAVNPAPESNSAEEPNLPWEDVEAARGDHRLQRRHRSEEARYSHAPGAQACPGCGTPATNLVWIYFESPARTWRELCGTAGWLTICDRCHLQIDYFEEVTG